MKAIRAGKHPVGLLSAANHSNLRTIASHRGDNLSTIASDRFLQGHRKRPSINIFTASSCPSHGVPTRRCRLAMTGKPSSDHILPPLDGSYRLARPGGDMSRGRTGAIGGRRRGQWRLAAATFERRLLRRESYKDEQAIKMRRLLVKAG